MIESPKINPQRVQERMDLLGFKQASLAAVLKVDQTLIGKIVQGKVPRTKHLSNLARVLGTTPDFLTDQIDEADSAAIPAAPAKILQKQLEQTMDVVQVQMIDLEYGMGATFLDGPHETKMISISRSWLAMFTDARPEDIFICKARGNSNQPDMQDGDWLICNSGTKMPLMADEYWCLTYYDLGMVRRLRRFEKGWKIIAGNPNVPEELAADGEMAVVGRVEAIIRRF